MHDLKTTIAISRELKSRLRAIKREGESFEDLINRLLEEKVENMEDDILRIERRDDWSPVFTAVFEKRGRIWVPKPIRSYLGVSEGDYLEVKLRLVGKKGLLRK